MLSATTTQFLAKVYDIFISPLVWLIFAVVVVVFFWNVVMLMRNASAGGGGEGADFHGSVWRIVVSLLAMLLLIAIPVIIRIITGTIGVSQDEIPDIPNLPVDITNPFVLDLVSPWNGDTQP